MNILKQEASSHGKRWIWLHDKSISKIICGDYSVIFCFDNGFDLIDDGELSSVDNGKVELVGCRADDIICHIVERIPTRRGEKIIGKPITLQALNKKITCEDQCAEIFLELYDDSLLHWRCEMYPKKYKSKKRLAPYVIIETDFFPMQYSWC